MSGNSYLYFPTKGVAFYINHLDEVDVRALINMYEGEEFGLDEEECFWDIEDKRLNELTIRDVSHLLALRERERMLDNLIQKGIWIVHLINECDKWEVVQGEELPEQVIRF
jgi:hypothetical protein